jgi:hypothetical protein
MPWKVPIAEWKDRAMPDTADTANRPRISGVA